MVRGLLILGLLAGGGWYAYRKLVGSGQVAADGASFSGQGSDAAGGVAARVTQSVSQAASVARQAATTVAEKARAAVPGSQGGAGEQTGTESGTADAMPREARAAAMATMQAVQPPATIPEPEVRNP